MKNNLKKILLLFLCVPVIFLAACGKSGTAKIKNLEYYFDSSVGCEFFDPDSTRTLSLGDLTSKKPNTDLLDKYVEYTISSNKESSRTYHLYIDYITLYVYMSNDSDKEFNLNLTIENVVDEASVGSEPNNTTFSDKRSAVAKKETSAEFRFDVNKVVNSMTGTSIKFDISETEIYNTPNDKNVDFKWLIYGLEIHAEPRAYN